MTNPLMDLIGSGEGEYNSYNRGTARDKNGNGTILPANQNVDFSSMTVREIQRRQALPSSDPDRMLAVGRYQFITSNLAEAIKRLEVDKETLFGPELQDRLFNEYLLPRKRWEVHDYIVGKEGASLRDAQKAICKEWASVEDPDRPGHVYATYERSGNKMHTRAADVGIVLDEMRAHYRARIEQAMSPVEAWAATTAMGPGQNAPALRGHSARHSVGTTLRHGSHGPAVSELQSQLARLGYTDSRGQALTADGHFGEGTRRAVEAFQGDHALAADGVAGAATLGAVKDAVRIELRSIGQADAAYLRGNERDEALSAYQALAPNPASTAPVMPSLDSHPATPKIDALHAVSIARLDAEMTLTLQNNLKSLGITDMRGESLVADGIYGMATQTAVARFQSGYGLPVTGQADERTRSTAESQAFIADLQQVAPHAVSRDRPVFEATRAPAVERATPSQEDVPEARLTDARSLNDPRHPESPTHDLYNELQRHLPDAGEDRLMQFTAACHVNKITADNLNVAHVDEENMTVHLRGDSLMSTPAVVDLKADPPQPKEAIKEIQQFDQQETQLAQTYQIQQSQTMQQSRSL